MSGHHIEGVEQLWFVGDEVGYSLLGTVENRSLAPCATAGIDAFIAYHPCAPRG
jgi:hypothetical protein